MSSFYPKALAAALSGALDVTALLTIQAIDATVTYDAADEFLADVALGGLGSPTLFTTIAVVGGVITADMPNVILGVGLGDDIKGYIVYVDTGSSATSRLVLFFDRAGDSTLIDTIGDGGNVNVTFTGGVIGSI